MPRLIATLTLAEARRMLAAAESAATGIGLPVPVRIDEQIVGAVGTSAGSVEQDIPVAEAAIAALTPIAATEVAHGL